MHRVGNFISLLTRFFMSESSPFIRMSNLSVQRNGRFVLIDITAILYAGECWAVVGPMGSGKTTFLQALAGQLPVRAGQLTRQASVGFVSFREESRQFSYTGYFYQQRYHATMSDGEAGHPMPTVYDFLGLSALPDSQTLMAQLGLTPLLDRAMLKLSNGQTRRVRIAKALLLRPDVLLLDNPFVGLDTASRVELTHWLTAQIQRGLLVVLVTDPATLPACITHVLALRQGRIGWAGPAERYSRELPIVALANLPTLQTPARPADFGEAFRLTNVVIRYGERLILDHVNWAIRAGERWALIGPNGAGKSVLLSLLYGDHPQAYANDVRVFGHQRGKTGQSIWEVKRRIGFVSPELHLYFPQHLTVRQVAFTGLTDTLTVPARPARTAETDLLELLNYFEVSWLIDQPFGNLSAGEQRLVLLVRALLKNPPVLILDEPFQVLDDFRVQRARHLLDSLPDKTLLFVTHDPDELPSSISQQLQLAPV